ncbi:MAG TPA: helix-turn-helix domain-containing protein [Dehalococcoidales bacterium]|nr:helix-turn-helix domain-containing protein [Dehalococcoidales bacterium]
MKNVFSTKDIEKTKRFAAWQEALCEHYLKVDTCSQNPTDYEGFLNKSILGPVVLSDVFLSTQKITRNHHHIALLDKDCFYIMFPSKGSLLVEQSGRQVISTPGTAALFDATVPYHLRCRDYLQSMYVEMPRSILIDRCPIDKLESVPALSFADGLGWAVAEFCKLVAFEADSIGNDVAPKVAIEIADLLALCIDAELNRKPIGEDLAKKFRLQSLKSYIESRLGDPDLSPEVIAKDNGISVRYLHYLFKGTGKSVSEWVRERRLEKCHQKLTSTKFDDDSITNIAFSLGFNSSSHFTRLFKQKFGMPPRYIRQKTKQVD